MNILLPLLFILLFSACGSHSETGNLKEAHSDKQASALPVTKKATPHEVKTSSVQNDDVNLIFANGPSRERINLNGETVVIIQFDSIETEQLKEISGEDRFYTATDDLMWYNSMILHKMDSLGVQVKYTKKDTVDIRATDFNMTIVKDSSFSYYTYFYFDGKDVKRAGLFELLAK